MWLKPGIIVHFIIRWLKPTAIKRKKQKLILLAEVNGNIEKKKTEIESCNGEYLLPSVLTDGSEKQIKRLALAKYFLKNDQRKTTHS